MNLVTAKIKKHILHTFLLEIPAIFGTYMTQISLLLCAFRVIYSTTEREIHIFRRNLP
nr:MAG TPA: hypothetical protein [Caudoviricetes sp.]